MNNRRPKGEIHRVLEPESIGILAGYFGAGKAIWIPETSAAPRADALAILIGLEQTSRLIDAFGGGTVYLPGLTPKSQAIPGLTPKRVAKLTASGKSAAAIAHAHGCSVRTVLARRAALKAEPKGCANG